MTSFQDAEPSVAFKYCARVTRPRIWAADAAEPIRVLVLNHFADELHHACFVDFAHYEHSTQVAEGVHRGVPVIGDYRRGEKTRELEAAVAVGVTLMISAR